MDKKNEKNIERIIEKGGDMMKDELETCNINEVLIKLYEKKRYQIFHELLIEHMTEITDSVLSGVCSQIINEKEIKQFFIELIAGGVEIDNIIRNIENGSHRMKMNKKEQQIKLLRIFHQSFDEFERTTELFQNKYENINKIINSTPKSGYGQIQSYPIVQVKGLCLICKNSLFDGQQVSVYPCGHGIHSACADYLNDSSIVCRACVSSSSLPLTIN